MSNFKKFLALVLATLMVASMMVITAPAASAYAPTGDYAADIALLDSLKVMMGDGESFKEKENVTRWQMALMIARIVTGETGNAMWEAEKSEYFTDVKADHYPGAIDFCAEMGYIKGIGDNLFDPEGNIIYQDALTMIVRLLGYETETTSYPWGYILQARTLGLTNEISTGNKTNLLREEVANLLVNAIHEPLAKEGKVIYTESQYADVDADGNPIIVTVKETQNLIETGLKGQKLGIGKLVATPTAAINGTALAAAKEVTFTIGTTPKTVKLANLTKREDYHINEYLGFTADLVAINVGTSAQTILATMHDVVAVDTWTYDGTNYKLTVDGNNYWNAEATFLQFNPAGSAKKEVVGEDEEPVLQVNTDAQKSVFVSTAVAGNQSLADFSGKGRILVCDVANDDDVDNDILRLIPYDNVRTIYTTTGTTEKANGDYWAKGDAIKVYFAPMDFLPVEILPETATVTADVTDDYMLVGLSENASTAIKRAWVGGDAFVDAGSGVSIRGRKGKYTFSNTFANCSDLYVAVNGDLENGVLHRGTTKSFGDATFVVVGAPVELADGTAVITGTLDNKVKLGDTAYSVGYTKVTVPGIHGWYKNFHSASDVIGPNVGEEVYYRTADGQVIYLEGAEGVIAGNPNTKTPVILAINEDNVIVNADNTLSVVNFNLETLKEETIKLGQIDGKNVASLVNNFGLAVAADMLLDDAAVAALGDDYTVADVVIALLDNAYTIETDTLTYTVSTLANKADDVYAISTANTDKFNRVIFQDNDGVANNSVVVNFSAYSAAALAKYNKGTFAGVEDGVATYNYASTNLSVNNDTTYVIFGSDGCANVTGIIPKGDAPAVLLSDAAGAVVLALDKDTVVIYNANKTIAEIANFIGAPTAGTATFNGGWYTLTWKSNYESMTVTKVGDDTYYNYYFTGLYNLTTGKTEPVTVSIKNEYLTNPESIFDDVWYKNGSTYGDVAAKKGQTYKKLYSVWYIGNDLGDGAVKSSMYSWGLANDYLVGKITGIYYNDPNTLVIDNVTLTPNGTDGYTMAITGGEDADKFDTDIVVSYKVKVFNQSKDGTTDEIVEMDHKLQSNDGYQGKILNNGNNTTAQGKAELVLYKVDENGNAYVIANLCDLIGFVANGTIVDGMAN